VAKGCTKEENKTKITPVQEEKIKNFIIGGPVFLSGIVGQGMNHRWGNQLSKPKGSFGKNKDHHVPGAKRRGNTLGSSLKGWGWGNADNNESQRQQPMVWGKKPQ